jgi:hypothetical protein
MDARPEVVQGDEVSLLDIYDFLRDGWITLLGASLLGALIGLLVSFVMPIKYQADALIESGQVGFLGLDQAVSSRPVESLDVLTEKMRSPSFYSDQTLTECGFEGELNPRRELIKELSPTVARNSNFVALSFKAESVDAAKKCIENVLADIVMNQQPKLRAAIEYAKSEIANTQSQVDQVRAMLAEQESDRDESLDLARSQLLAARQELKILDQAQDVDKSVANAMSLLQVLNKRSEVQELEAMLLRLQTNFAETQSDRNDQVNRLTNRLLALQSSIKPPNTRDPQFATPVFASDTKVSPLRGLILLISLLVGGFVGLIILIGRRIIKHVLAQEAERKKQMAG